MLKHHPDLPGPVSLLSHHHTGPSRYVIRREVQKPPLKEASIHTINFAIVKIICKICIINIIKSLVGKTSDMRVKGSLGRAGLSTLSRSELGSKALALCGCARL